MAQQVLQKNILLENSNQQSRLTYISSYRPPIQIYTVHCKEQDVMDYLSKFHLNRTVNESGNAVLKTLCRLEKQWRIEPKSQEPGACGIELAPGDSCYTKNMNNIIFHEHNTTRIA